jgi:hypothetical protein
MVLLVGLILKFSHFIFYSICVYALAEFASLIMES